MCGITGIYAFNEIGRFNLINLQRTIDSLTHRGPDAQGSYFDDRVGLGHRRLAVIDTRAEANQPMFDHTRRFVILYNGEIYNYRELRAFLENNYPVSFTTESDTEVLLYAYIHLGEKCLDRLNGFFAFAIYDIQEKELFLARDRFGIKPLYYYQDEDKWLFASEMRSIIGFGIDKSIDYTSLLLYFQLSYVPAPFTMLERVRKLLPGYCIRIKGSRVEIKPFYRLPEHTCRKPVSYKDAKKEIKELLEDSVRQRLVADVPLGIFLSGGIDSSLITAMASRHREELNTFSVGYAADSYFDETKYARQVASHFGTRHHAFQLSRNDLLENLNAILDHIDEPFADSSAIPVYILSRLTRKEVTVALSGDGADELFSGYNKHLAFLRSQKNSFKNQVIRNLGPIWKIFPQSRNNPVFDIFRQLDRYSSGLKRSGPARYWKWAGLMEESQAAQLILPHKRPSINYPDLAGFRQKITSVISDPYDLNEILYADINLVLPNDMLYKVDLMSMAWGLEVRVPFLDQSLVETAMSLPSAYKINTRQQKILLRDILSEYIPGKLAQRPKHGFEVPLLGWFRKELKDLIKDELLAPAYLQEQEIFDPAAIRRLTRKLFSSDPGDSHAHIWAMIVFQSWWKKYFS